MKTLKYILMTLATGGLLTMSTSCSDFLETTPSTSVSDQSVFTSVAGAQAALNGCYFQMRAYNGGGAGREDDYGVASLLMISESCGEDMIAWGGWYIYNYNYWGETRGDIFRSSQLWTFHYRLINNVNSVLAYIDGISGDQKAKDHIKGQAMALRGWAYFSLARLFQQTYAIAKDMPGVPIYTEPTTDQTEGKGRGTLEQTYKQVLDDLTTAETLLEGYVRTPDLISNVDQSVVQGILSQVYLTMNNWTKAEYYSKLLLEKYPLTTNEQYLAGFNDHTTESWIWGQRQTEEQNMGDFSPFAMWANRTRPCYSFEGWVIPDNFVTYFNEGDIRGTQFEWWGNGWDVHVSYKFRDNADCRGSILWMRSEEMLFNAVEALYHQPDKEDEAKELLWTLQDMRGANRTVSTGKQLLEDILLERRKELYGEGLATYDMIRNQRPLVRESNHVRFGGAKQLPPRSWEFIYQIPRNEILNNKALVDDIWPKGDQNPFTGVYEP